MINEAMAYALGLAIADVLMPSTAVIGHDVRLSSMALENSLGMGLKLRDVKIFLLGLCGTEEVYHACANYPYDVGLMITGSHNPKNENGFKIVTRGAVPLSELVLKDIASVTAQLMNANQAYSSLPTAILPTPNVSYREGYIKQLLDSSGFSRFKSENRKPIKVLVDAGNGCAGLVLSRIKDFLPFDFIEENFMPDGNFPIGVPNPLLPDRRDHTSRRIVESGADLGVAFDGDFDRCFFYGRHGEFIDGYYIVGLLAQELLRQNPGEKVIHDPRVYWNTREIVSKTGGKPIMAKTGHAFIKAAMRQENALYGGEMSAHHYFRNFAYCDSGIMTMLLVLRSLLRTSKDLDELVYEMRSHYPISGEINFKLKDPDAVIANVWNKYLPHSTYQDKLDGLNMEFRDWRFSLRKSNTENLLRLNLESRGQRALLEEKVADLSSLCAD